ncbi:MAG: dihydroorotate dehydrogenase electron transfer subunit [Deltaproteobacteria bacterium]|nr:dihydroorotate dehydrogenase electron transfer subunit [Deltaproteobacteria bacterium]
MEECLGSVVAIDEPKKDHFLLTLRVPESFSAPLPGQFVMLRQTPSSTAEVNGFSLPRPFSVYDFTAGSLMILFRRVGKVTSWMAHLSPGEALFIRGPLGNHFPPPTGKKNIMVFAGGIGVAPMHFFTKYFRKENIRVFVGAKTDGELLLHDTFCEICNEVKIATDDGSYGRCGLVTDFLPTSMEPKTVIYACGPKSMLQSLSMMIPAEVDCHVSLEERMACGIGACLGCAVEIWTVAGEKTIRSVCKDGPVFPLKNVVWENK